MIEIEFNLSKQVHTSFQLNTSKHLSIIRQQLVGKWSTKCQQAVNFRMPDDFHINLTNLLTAYRH